MQSSFSAFIPFSTDPTWSDVEPPFGVAPEIEALASQWPRTAASADDEDFDEDDFDDDFDDDFEDELDEELNDDLDEFDQELEEEEIEGAVEGGDDEAAEPLEEEAEDL